MNRLLGRLGGLATLLLAAAAAASQGDPKLLGRWVGSGEDNKGETLVITKDHVVIDDEKVPYRITSPGVLVLDDGDDTKVRYQVDGDTLTVTMDGERATYRREGGKPETPPNPPPMEDPPVKTDKPNRLAKPPAPAADPFARRFEGDGVKLSLAGTAATGYRGTLEFQGSTYQVQARAEGRRLTGSFEVQGSQFDLVAKLDGDALALESGGSSYSLKGEPLAEGSANPLEGGGRGPASPAGAAPPELPDVDSGKTTRFDHPRGWFSFDMPEGWTVYSQDDTGMLLNPGLTATDTLDAMVGLMWGRLEKADLDQPVATVMEKYVPRLQQALAQQGIQIGAPETPPATYRGKDVPGGVLTYKGRTAQGKELQVWFGGIVKRDSWIAVSGMAIAGKEARYLPKVRRIFTSLEPKPPERNEKLEAALVGREFSSSQYGRVTPSAHHATYSFAAGNAVTRRLMSSVSPRPGMPGAMTDSERTGRYEVCGDVLFLYFDTGQEAGQVLVQGSQVAGIRIGQAEYR